MRCDGEGERLLHAHKVCCSLLFLVDKGSGDVLVFWIFSSFVIGDMLCVMAVWRHRFEARRVRFELKVSVSR